MVKWNDLCNYKKKIEFRNNINPIPTVSLCNPDYTK